MIDLKWLKSTQTLTGNPLSGKKKLPVATNIGKGRIATSTPSNIVWIVPHVSTLHSKDEGYILSVAFSQHNENNVRIYLHLMHCYDGIKKTQVK